MADQPSSYNEQVLSSDTSQEAYVRISQLAKMLGWQRPKTYYWLARCPDVEVFEMAGIRMVLQKHLPQIILRLKQVHKEAMIQRGFRE